jgi:hypothetical protein
LGYDGVKQKLSYKPFELLSKHNELYIHLLDPGFRIKQTTLYNVMGQVVDAIPNEQIVGTNYALNHLHSGIYIAVITDENNKNYATRFFKQ